MAPDPLRDLLDALDLIPLGDDAFEGRCVERERPRMFVAARHRVAAR